MKRNSNGNSSVKKERITPAAARRIKWKTQAIDLYLKGNSQLRVKDLMFELTGHSFSPATINKYIQEGTAEWRESKNQMVANHKEIELEKINRLETEYWLAWERSKLNYKNTSKTKTTGASKGDGISQVKTDERASNGDPRFLEGIHRCVEMRNKLLGIEVPQIQINQTNTGGQSTTIIQRRVVFKTRETTTQQIIEEEE